MRNQKEVVTQLKKTSKYAGMEISGHEILLLSQIYVHRIMNTKSIHEFLQFSSGGRNPNAITNRIKKMVDAGVLVRLTEPHPFFSKGFNRYFYRLGVRGLRVLISMGYCSAEEGGKMLRTLLRLGVPKTHANAASLTANRILLAVSTPDTVEYVRHLRGAVHPLFVGETLTIESRGIIVPDWVFETDNHVVCLEIDTASSRGKEILSKIKRYIKRANDLKQKDKELVVIFSVLDDTLESIEYSNRFRRIASLKELIAQVESIPLNLSFYSLQTKNTEDVMKRLYSGVEPASIDQREAAIHDWLGRFGEVSKMAITTGDMDGLLSSSRNRAEDGEVLLQLEVDGNEKRVVVIYGEEGSVDTYHRIRANAYRIHAYNQKISPAEAVGLLVVYKTKENMTEEVIGWHSPVPIWMTSMDLWGMTEDELEEGCRFMHLRTPFKAVWEDWEVLSS